MQAWAACLTLCMPCWPQTGPAHPCQPPYLQAQPFSLMGGARHPHGGTSGLLPDDFIPVLAYSAPLPGLSKVPAPVLASQALPRRQAWRCGQPASPTQLLAQGILPACQHANQCMGALERAGQGARLQQSPTAAAVPSKLLVGSWSGAHPWHDNAQPCGQFWVHPALSLARGGDYYRVRIATG